MTKSELLRTLRTERTRLQALLHAVGVDRMAIPGVSGIYSTKDIVAHLMAYERALDIWLKEARASRVYVDSIVDQPDLDARNAAIYVANRDHATEEILRIFSETYDELEECVAHLTDEELADVELTDWFVVPRWKRSQELWRCIANDSYEHHHQHIPDLEEWLAQHGSIG